jgi:hypothetical protein
MRYDDEMGKFGYDGKPQQERGVSGMSNKPGLVIRPFVDNDFSAIANYQLPEEQAIYTSLPIHVIEAHQKNPDYQPFVVYMDEELIGCFALHARSTGNLYTANENAIVFKSLFIFHLRLDREKSIPSSSDRRAES